MKVQIKYANLVIDYGAETVYPVKIQELLDKSLDQAVITLKNLVEKKPFEPLTDVVIDDTYRFKIAKDNVTQVIYSNDIQNSARYNHDLVLIEETKELEKYFVDTCTFTNSLFVERTNQINVQPILMNTADALKYWDEYEQSAGITINRDNVQVSNNFNANLTTTFFKSPVVVLQPTIAYTGFASIFGVDTVQNTVRLAYRIYEVGTNILISSGMSNQIGLIPISYPEKGKVYRYEFIGLEGSDVEIISSKIYGGIYYVANANNVVTNPITITDVVNRLLAITETQRVGDTPRFVFNQEQSTKYASVLAPEFAITKSTLREALQQVGGYIHAEPRLVENTIYFDELGKMEYATLPDEYVSYTASQDIEQFCSEIDSNVDNLVNIDDEQTGTIVEPFAQGYKTTRVELGTVDVTDSNAFIETTMPIEKIIKVEFGYLENNTFVGDITPYIYESAEYSILDSYDGVYPYSKAWALYYTQGQRNIYGLNFEQPDAISQYFQKPAIINILERKTGLSGFASVNPLSKMQFRVTYIPVVSARVKQRKSYLGATNKKSVLAYNASANKVDTDYYGENLKGAVERLGNIEKTLTYYVKSLSDVPKPGQLFNKDYYISAVTTEILPDYIKFTIGLSKDYNRWNEYVGINNNQRFYEVSEKQSVERYVVYEDYLIVGYNVDVESESYNKTLVKSFLLDGLYYSLIGGSTVYRNLTAISFSGYTADNNLISTVTMPAVSFALGNSAFYQISMDNSFGAGTYIQGFNNAKGFQTQREYGDVFGNIESAKIEGFYRPINTIPQNYNDAVEQGSKVPNLEASSEFYKMFSTENNNIIIKKDSREKINFAYQIHCVTNNQNIIIGSGLPKKLGVKDNGENYTYGDLYILDRRIGKFEKEIKDTLPTRIDYNVTVSTANSELNFDTIVCNRAGKSIIMIDRETKELLFAINEDVENGQIYTLPKLMFRHKIYE